MNFLDYSNIETPRLTLRLINKDHEALVYKLRSNPEVCKYIARPLFVTPDEAKEQVEKVLGFMAENESITWVLGLKNSSIEIGTICLWNFSKDRKTAEVGYDSLPEYQGHGYMTEALEAVIDFGFKTLNLKTIEAFTSKRNLSSIKLLQKQNFKLQTHRLDPENAENNIYCLTI